MNPITYTPQTLNELPSDPGIYKMLNKNHEVIYIGKAKHLKKRVKQYFSKSTKDIKTQVMVKQIVNIDVIVTQTEKEALLLENQLIKSLKPRYNILLKDDKTYPYIKVTVQEPFPRIMITRTKQQDGARYYGPYPSMGSTRALRRLLYDIFPLRDCKQDITRTEKQPKCLLLDLNKCLGPCVIKTIEPEYQAIVATMHDVLMGKNKATMKELEQNMKACSDAMEFEKAAQYRDKLDLLQRLIERQTVDLATADSFQLWVFQTDKRHDYVLVQEIIKGKLLAQRGFYQTSPKPADHPFHVLAS